MKKLTNIIGIALILLIVLPQVYADAPQSKEEQLTKKLEELNEKIRINQIRTRENEAKKERTLKDEKVLELLKRDHKIQLNDFNQVQRDLAIEKVKPYLDRYQKELDSLEWFIATEKDPEKLKQFEAQRATAKSNMDASREAYNKIKYPPVDWGAFAEGMFTGFATGRFYDTYHGLAKAGSLLLSKDELERNAKALRTLFCDVLHFPTFECVSSRLCRKFPDSIKRDRTVVTRTATNVVESVAHVEGFKSQPIPKPESRTPKSERLYTGTVAVLNNLNTALDFSVELIGPGSTYIWINNEKLSPGQGYSKPKTSPLISYLEEEYEHICLVLNPGIKDYRGNTHTRLCSPLVVK